MQGGGPGVRAASPPPLPSPSLALAARLGAEELALLAGAKMRCGGCGSKVGASTLTRVLRRLQQEGEGGAAAGAAAEEGSGEGLEAAAGAGAAATVAARGAAAAEAAAGRSVVLGLDSPDDAAVLEPPPPGHVTVRSWLGGTGCALVMVADECPGASLCLACLACLPDPLQSPDSACRAAATSAPTPLPYLWAGACCELRLTSRRSAACGSNSLRLPGPAFLGPPAGAHR